MNESMPVLSIRLKMPQPRKNYVARERLFEKLNKINDYKVSVIKGGAGSGKTTLLSSFIKERKVKNVKWVSLDENVNEVFTFWKYITEALLEYLGDEAESFRKSFDGNIQKDNIVTILTLFINSISSFDEINLVLDDFHLINDEFLISTIDFFIENMPINMHIIMLSREVPNIYLGNLIINDEVLLIDEDEIKFNKMEGKSFLTNTLKIKKDNDTLDKLIDASEGWIGGLQLMAIANRDKSSSFNFKIENSVINDYITREIFNYLSKAQQDFLIKTSILRYFNEEICCEFLPEYNFKVLIESILEKNLFVINIDENKGIYRYHAILSKYLEKYYQSTNSNLQENNKLHSLAAKIYIKIGDYEEGLYHLFLIKDYDKIMETLLKMPQNSVTYSYILKVPMEQIIKNPDFAYQYFFCQYASMNVKACQEAYDFIVSNMKQEKSLDAFKHVDVFLSVKCDFSKVNILSVEQIKKFNVNKVTRAYLLIKESYFLFAKGNNNEAMEYLNYAEEIYKEINSIYVGFFIFAEKTQIFENLGELNKSLSVYKEMERYLDKVPSLAASYYVGIAGVYIKRLELSKAKEALDKVKKYVSSDKVNLATAYNFTMAEYLYTCGNSDNCEEIINNMFKHEDFEEVIMYGARLLRYPILRKRNNDLCIKFINQYKKIKDEDRIIDSQVLYSRIIYEEGKENEAIEIAENIITRSRKEQNKLMIVEGNLLKLSFIIDKCDNERKMKNLFIEALSYAQHDKICHPFWYDKDTVFKVMKKYKKVIVDSLDNEQRQFLEYLLQVISNPSVESDEEVKSNADIKLTIDNKYQLTEREIEVFTELSKGYTNKQIAQKLYITLATVKTHIINIYGKLGVNNRMQAINKYLDMKL